MTKIIEILELFNEIDFTCDCISICETTISDASKALKKDPQSSELNEIFESASSDKAKLDKKLETLKEKFNSLVEQLKADPEAIQEVEKTTMVPERLKKALNFLKMELTSPKGYEKPEE